MDINTLPEWIGLISTFIAGASIILGVVARITAITQNTRDDEVVGKVGKALKAAQKVLGALALDSGTTAKKAVTKEQKPNA